MREEGVGELHTAPSLPQVTILIVWSADCLVVLRLMIPVIGVAIYNMDGARGCFVLEIARRLPHHTGLFHMRCTFFNILWTALLGRAKMARQRGPPCETGVRLWHEPM